MAGVRQNGKWGIINEQNQIIIPFTYDDISNFVFIGKGEKSIAENAKYARAYIGKKMIFIDKSGERVKAKKVEEYLPLRGILSGSAYDK